MAFLLNLQSAKAENDIKLGTAKLTVRLETPGNIPLDSVETWADVVEIFFGSFEDKRVDLHRDGNAFSADIPLQLKKEIIGVEMACRYGRFGFPLAVCQDHPIEVSLRVDSSFVPVMESFSLNDPQGMSVNDWMTACDMAMRCRVHVPGSTEHVVPADRYDSWKKVRDYEFNVIWPYQKSLAIDGREIPSPVKDWVINDIKCQFAARQIIPYVPVAERMARLSDVASPPMEAYTFLDSIDYSPDVFLTHSPYAGLKPFLYTLLRFPDGGFERIGEMPVSQWKDMTREKLRPTIAEPSDLLLDLLSAMCYVEQVDILNKPLTPTQKDNIQNGYTNDLGRIILMKDQVLVGRLEAMKQLVDLSGQPFTLQAYIDGEFPGLPVVVDLWNSWCSPCIDAMRRADSVRNDMDTQDVAFLYISDTTSDKGDWERMAPDIHGTNVRIGDEAMGRLMESYGLTGFPSYLFFDRNHKLGYAGTTFPGTGAYRNLLKTIITK